MTKHFAWLGVATLVLAASVAPARAGDPLKPYVVLILDTSGSMDAVTGSGPPSCGGTDTRIEHATCAINKIVNSYGDMVFALGRFRETTNGTFATTCDANGDLNGNVSGTFPTPSGGDQCSTGGVYCGDCDENVGLGITCTPGDMNCFPYDGSGICTAGRCAGFGICTQADREFQLLTPLVDGNNQQAAAVTDRSCGTCSMPAAGTAPTTANEIWGVSPNTFTPLAAVLRGAKLYWLGQEFASDATTTIWPASAGPAGGFSPIGADLTNTSFLPTGCNSSPSCTVNCCASQCRPYITILLTDGAETCTTFANTTAAAASMLTTDVGGRRYRVETKPIGFGITPGNAQIEGMAHAGGEPDLPGNQGFYAANEAELQLAISSILDDAIKTEVCNNLDDDCDVDVDEDFEPAKDEACNNNRLGKCRVNGTNVCRADGTGLQCTAGQAACAGLSQGNACTVTNAANDPVAGTCQVSGPILVCQPTAAPNEIPFGCNNIDDDCDGIIDEGVTGCSCSPQGESCDGDDDDCDGTIDEGITIPCGTGTCLGTRTCVVGGTGTFGPCIDGMGNPVQQPTPEICNGLDDNCDGIIDGFQQACSTMPPLPPENFPIDDPRNNPGHPTNNPIPENVCQPGIKVCPANPPPPPPPNSFGACQNEIKPCDPDSNPSTPCPDLCNGLDDDCDNLIDEDFAPADCSTSCGLGQTECVGGMIQCNQMQQPTDDTCNGIDDDCNGQVDEDWVCSNPPMCSCTAAGICNGVEDCIGGNVVCNGTPVGQESCNCLDDNCNMAVDDGVLCPPGAMCTSCQCAFPCLPGEFPCPAGKYCNVDNFCVADPCFGVVCDPVNGNKQVCRPVGNTGHECISACEPSVAMCGGGEVCIGATGECKPDNCETFPMRCAANENCIAGVCVLNPCQGVPCEADEYCVGGQCYGSCADLECPTGQRCRMGVCETDPCGHPCPFGQVCIEATGECQSDPCAGNPPCPINQTCNPQQGGQCTDDPCIGVTCPGAGQKCKYGTCFDEQDLLPDAGVEERVTTGGGGGCSTSDGGGTFAVLAMLFLVGWRRRRRNGVRA